MIDDNNVEKQNVCILLARMLLDGSVGSDCAGWACSLRELVGRSNKEIGDTGDTSFCGSLMAFWLLAASPLVSCASGVCDSDDLAPAPSCDRVAA